MKLAVKCYCVPNVSEAGVQNPNPRKRKKQSLKMGHGGTLDSAASGVLGKTAAPGRGCWPHAALVICLAGLGHILKGISTKTLVIEPVIFLQGHSFGYEVGRDVRVGLTLPKRRQVCTSEAMDSLVKYVYLPAVNRLQGC